jgi:rubrerythrin
VLTDAGRRVTEQISATRLDTLTTALDRMTDQEQASLHFLLGRVMDAVVRKKVGGPWICRQCDFAACERSSGLCPAATAAQARAGGQ